MVYSFLQALKRALVLSQLRLGDPRDYRRLDPEPRQQPADMALARDTRDDWLFDEPDLPLSPFVHGLSRELDRVSGSLGLLRELLSEISRFTPDVAVPVNGLDAPITLGTDGFLFDGEALPRLPGDRPYVSGDAIFLFEESDHPARLSVFDSPLMDKRLAA